MRSINYLLITVLFLACQITSAKAQDQGKTLIGKYENEGIVLQINKSETLKIYNANLLRLSGIDAKLTEVSVTTSNKEYFLVFKGASYKSIFAVTITGSEVYAIGSISCTTSACVSERMGCTVRGLSCEPCGDNGSCTKTTTTGSLLDKNF